MATQVSTSGQRRQVLGSEEYSLYSSLSEDELIQMAIEQSLLEGNSGQTTACSNQKQSDNLNERATAASLANRQTPRQTQLPQHNRSAQPSAAPSHNPGSNKATRRRYDGSYFSTPQAVEKTPIERAIMNKDAETISKMIKSGQKLNEPNKDGWLPLHDAAYYGSLEVMKILLQAYPNSIDQRTLQEETATLISTTKGHIDCLLFMLQSGADPDIANKNKETPIYKACETKNVEALKLLIQYHADVNHRCNRGLVALHEAVSRNDLEIISILEKSGAKVDAKNIYGITPLFTAAQIGKVDLLRYLTKCGADINTQANDDATALFEASKNGHDEAVEFLLSQGADANKQNKHGFLPIHIAAKKRDNTDVVSMLIPVTSRVRVKRSGISPLHIAAERNNDDVLEELIDAGYDVNMTLSFDRARLYEDRRSTALYFAVMNNNLNAAEMLLKAGAKPNVDLINPLLISIRHGCCKMIKLLLDHGANVNTYISSHPTSFPATVMFAMKYLSLLKFVMDHGCDGESCFKCDYGNGPHPPIEVSSREDDAPKEPKIVQFCEMISAPEISRWAGPIIDVLLDYVGNVSLCSRLQEHLDSYEDWANIKKKSEPPRPLLHLCRLKVRDILGLKRLKKINRLPLPPRLIRYLSYDYSEDY